MLVAEHRRIGTCDEIGRRSTWVALDSTGPLSLTISMRFGAFELPSDVAERLPKALIHHNVPGEKVNGALTVGENIGDLGGLTIAHKAYLISLGDESLPERDGLTGSQRLFCNWAYAWRVKRRVELARQYLTIDPHSPSEFRANIVRNLWSNSIILCGHFPEGVETFEKRSIEGESKGDWYVRQMLGSANISGSRAMHLMSGNLSHQIEHHLFPDLPSNRYAEIAPKVQALFDKYDLTYLARPLVPQVYSAWHKVVRLSLPNGFLETTTPKNLPSQAKLLWAMTTKGPKVRRAAQARLDPLELTPNRRQARARGLESSADLDPLLLEGLELYGPTGCPKRKVLGREQLQVPPAGRE